MATTPSQASTASPSGPIRRRIDRRLPLTCSMLARPLRTIHMLRDQSLVIAFPVYRRYTRRVATQTVAGIVVIVVLLVAGFATATTWLVAPPLVILVAVGLAALWDRWRHGSRALVRRGLPPGELTQLACPLLDVDHHRRFADEFGPVFTTNHLNTPLVAVYGLERGHEVLHRCRADLGPMPRPDNDLVVGGFVRVLEGDEHRRMRTTLAPLFGPAFVERLRPRVESQIDAGISGWSEGDDPVHPRPLVEALVLDVWLTLFFGPAADYEPERLTRLRELYRQIDHLYPTPDMRSVQDRIVDEVQALGRLRDLPDCALRELVTRSPESLDDLPVIENLVHIVTSTHADMTGLFAWIVKFVADNADSADRVRNSSPEKTRARADAFVSESLRLAQSEVLLRYTKRPIVIGDHKIPERWMLRVLVRESHRDPEVFDDPLAFRPERFVSGSYGRFEYSPFGLDGRSCIGEALTRMASGVFVTRLVNRFDIEVCEDGPLQLSVHRHAAPNHHWTVRFRQAPSPIPDPSAR